MEFNSGVVFIKDNNTIANYYNNENKPDVSKYLEANVFLDTPGYTSKPYYKMYAIGNMGNDKKNIHIFHDTTNPKAKENGSNRTSYTNTNNGMKIEFDKGVKGANGFKGKDHYHIKNPSSTGKSDYYLDINGNPCPKNSTKSHIVIKKGGYK